MNNEKRKKLQTFLEVVVSKFTRKCLLGVTCRTFNPVRCVQFWLKTGSLVLRGSNNQWSGQRFAEVNRRERKLWKQTDVGNIGVGVYERKEETEAVRDCGDY